MKEVLADVKRKTVSIFESSLFVLAMAFSNSKSPLFRTPLTIKFASTFLQKSIVRELIKNKGDYSRLIPESIAKIVSDNQ